MTQQNAKDYLPLVQALADGQLQHYAGRNWQNVTSSRFSAPPQAYRRRPVGPLPWALMDQQGKLVESFKTEAEAKRWASSTNCSVVYVMEVVVEHAGA